MSATGHTSSEFTPGYLLAHLVCPTWLTVQPVIFSGPTFTEPVILPDSMHGGAPSGIQVLFGKWVPLGHHWLGLHHAALRMSGTWSGQSPA